MDVPYWIGFVALLFVFLSGFLWGYGFGKAAR